MVKRGLILGGVLALFGCASAYAEGAEFSIDVSSATLQLTVPESVNIELQPTSSAAVFDSKPLTFNVATNNPTGYRVIISVPQTEMLHSSITTANIPTLSSTTTEANFPANKWGFKTTGDYNPINLSNEDAAWNNNNPTNGTNHSLTLAAKVDGSQVAGIYTNTLTFTAVVNPNTPKLTISFDGNSADSGTMNSVSVFSGETANLPFNKYTKSGFLFNGWNEKIDNTGTGYGDEDFFTAPTLITSQTKILYAQWIEDTGQGASNVGKTLQRAYEEAYMYNSGSFEGTKHGLYVPEKDSVTGEYTGNYFEATRQSDYDGIPASDLRFAIQDIGLLVDNKKVCERATVIGSEALVLDLRDFKSYWIAKLANGQCWMTQNLDLDLSTNITLDNTNTDLNDKLEWTPDSSTITSSNGQIAGNAFLPNYNIETSSRVPRSANVGEYYWHFDGNSRQSCAYYNNPSCKAFSTSPFDDNQLHGHVGNHYNWTAAIAENASNTTFLQTAGSIAPNSICPSGWRLPYASTENAKDDYTSLRSFYQLYPQQSSSAPLFFTYTERVVGGTIEGGHDVWYWTSSPESTYDARALYGNNNSNYDQIMIGSWSRYDGFAVRCIAR